MRCDPVGVGIALLCSSLACVHAGPARLPGGEAILGTSDVRPQGEDNFLISPDGRFLAFESSRSDPFLPLFVVIDLERSERKEVRLSAEVKALAAEGRGPVRPGWRFDSGGDGLVLRNELTSFRSFIGVPWPQLEICSGCERELPPATGQQVARVVSPSASEVTLVDALDPTRILARHRQSEGSRVSVRHVSATADGQYLSYLLYSVNAGFPAPARGYVIGRRDQRWSRPIEVAKAVYGPLQWSPDGTTLFVCLRVDHQSDGIVRWSRSKIHELLDWRSSNERW